MRYDSGENVRIQAVKNGYILTMRSEIPGEHMESQAQTFVFNSATDMATFIGENFPEPPEKPVIKFWDFK